MAKADLQKLVSALKEDVESYRKTADAFPHTLVVSRTGIYSQLINQIKAEGFSIRGRAGILDRLAHEAFQMIVRSAVTRKNSPRYEGVTEVELIGDVLYVHASGLLSNFDRIRDIITKDARDMLLAKVNEMFSSNIESDNFLDTGHHKSIGELQTGKLLEESKAAQTFKAPLISSIPSISDMYTISSHYDRKGNKVFNVRVELESASVNRSKVEDKEKKQEVIQGIEKFIASRDWATQAGSDSQARRVSKTIQIALNGKGEKPDLKAATASVKTTKKPKVTQVSLDIPVKKPRKSSINLIALINKKLPEEIRKRMTYPRLVYRTGRFAESARVVSQVQNPNSITLSFTYQKYPYQVFEPGGRLYTPARNPRVIIDESVRAIARSAMEARFYTRRI
jgi:hypothetical protein